MQRDNFSLCRKGKTKNKIISALPSRHTKFDVGSISVWVYDAIWTLNRLRISQGFVGNFIWWTKIIHAF